MGNVVKSFFAATAALVSFGSAWAEANAYWEYDAAAGGTRGVDCPQSRDSDSRLPDTHPLKVR